MKHGLHVIFDALQSAKNLRPVYAAEIAVAIHEAIPTCDQHQSNALYGVHQLRVRRPGDPVPYRVIVAPVDAPITIGKVPADEHFARPLIAPAADKDAAA